RLRIEARIAPHRAELIEARAGGVAGERIHRSAVLRIAGDVEHGLARLAACEPGLHDLEALELRARAIERAGILERRDREPRRSRAARGGRWAAAHRHAARVAARGEVGGAAQLRGVAVAAEEAHLDARPA